MMELSSLSGSSAYAYSVQNYLSQSNTKSSQTESSQGLAGLDALFEKAGNSKTTQETGTGQIGLSDDTLQAIFQSLANSGTQTTGSPDVSAMDTDGDGTITQEEFLAARPDDVTEEMAANLWNSFDTEGAGSLTVDELETAMASDQSGIQDLSSETSFISAMDTDGDGTITQEEFLAARPDDVTEEMATNLWNSFDTEGTGSLTVDELETAMASGPAGGAPPPPMASSDDSSSTDSVSSLDTNGDGIISQAEFLAGHPEEVSDDMAQALWDSFDTEGTGELSVSALESAMEENKTTSSTATSSQTTSLSSLETLLNAIKSYQSTSNYGSSQFMLNSLYGSLA